MSSVGLETLEHRGTNGSLSGQPEPGVKAGSSVCLEEPCKQSRGENPYDLDRGTGQHQANDEVPSQVPIAIVGMAVRLPGGVRSTDSFWDLLLSQKDISREVPQDRYNIDAFYSDTQPRAVKARRGYFLDHDMADTDPSAFNMMENETGHLDPQQRLLLEVVWECMENAGQADWRGKDIGCYVGSFSEDWLEMSFRDPLFMSRYHVFGASDFALSNRISYEYDLRGPR
ncbi:ketoacyl-synt-domain-containing protein [Aspergillus campestris IBT 28561]|uniref:Ketoacyl-synt-domain-containing protein n=1 Tax=Aspergillus campestris (strain IBT 28561) TaxID=1392248 RepID=A0A2I1CW97_ASPC2|nr:ketoacyl-synt-domain-containing protein [Aspergillus campestris IBT 28561]PKY01890.1 ketoacyl-synt-domain-containing protein [Aspergillus campestris IBT 28561]